MGLLTQLALTTLLAFASLAAARSICGAGRGTRTASLVTAAVLAHGVVITSVYGLGSLRVISKLSLGGTVSAVCLGILALVVVRDGGWRLFVDGQRAQLAGYRSVPEELLRACRLAGMPLWPIVIACGAVFGWIAFAVCVSPPPGNNDALFYHEPIVAMTIQTGHFGPYELPRHLQRINGMPRFCHFMQLWFAMFTGRDLVELPNVLSIPVGVLSTFGLLRRVGTQKSTAIAWALCWAMTPGIVRLSSGVMVDAHSAALVMAAAYLTLAPRLTVGRALVAALAIGLTVGTKYHVLVVTFVLAVALLVRLLAQRRSWSPVALWLTIAACASAVLVAVASLYARNWIIFENPIWPAGVKLPSLGIELRSANDMRDVATSGKGLPPGDVFGRWLSAPFTRRAWQGGSASPEDFGVGGLYIAWPLALVGSAWALVKAALRKRERQAIGSRLWVVIACAMVNVAALLTFPSFVRGRYWLVVLGLYFVVACWLLSAPRWRRLARQLAFVMSLLTIASVLWSLPRGWVPEPAAVWKRLKAPASARDYTARQLSTITPKLGALRAREMTAGKVVGYDTGLYSIGILWNDDYSNEVRWLRGKNAVPAANKAKVDWLFLHSRKARGADLKDWESLGPALHRKGKRGGLMYRRINAAR